LDGSPIARYQGTQETAMHPLTLLFLTWIAERPRTYPEAMDAWRTSCPRLSIWEDAVIDGLVAVAGDGTHRGAKTVALTPRGQALLDRDAASASDGP
jgi:hypothetical protein